MCLENATGWGEAPYAYQFPDGRTAITGTVERAEPPRLLVMTFSPQWSPAVAADPPSRVTWRILPADGGTMVSVMHEGVPAGTATASEMATGWPHLLSSLKQFIESKGS